MDQIDTNILFHLQNQARLSMTELGKLVGLSQPAVTERVKRLEESGVIEEYRTIISPQKIGRCRVLPIFFFAHGIVMPFLISAVRHPK